LKEKPSDYSLRTPEPHMEVNRPNPHFFTPNFPQKTVRTSFFGIVVLLGSSDVGEARKPDLKS